MKIEINFRDKPSGRGYAKGLAMVHMYLYATTTTKFSTSSDFEWNEDPHKVYWDIEKYISADAVLKNLVPDEIKDINPVEDTRTARLAAGKRIEFSNERTDKYLKLPIPLKIESKNGIYTAINNLTLVAQMFSTSSQGYIVGKDVKVLKKSALADLARSAVGYKIYPDQRVVYVERAPIQLYNMMRIKYPSTLCDKIPEELLVEKEDVLVDDTQGEW